MLGKNQNQSAAEGATAIQTTGNVLVQQGYTLAEVERLFGFLLAENFPKLKDAARDAAKENIREFAQTFTKEIKRETGKIIVDKFADPDVQAAINDAVQACARKGETASPDVLSKLLVHRMEENSPFLDTVLNEAVVVVPKLTKAQIAFTVYVHACRSLIPEQGGYSMLENLGKVLLPLAAPGFGLSDAQRRHLQYAGVMTVNTFTGGEIYKQLFDKLGARLNVKTEEEFKEKIKHYCPTYNVLLENFNNNKLFETDLTSVGYAISVAVIKQVMDLEFSIWIK